MKQIENRNKIGYGQKQKKTDSHCEIADIDNRWNSSHKHTFLKNQNKKLMLKRSNPRFNQTKN